MEDKLTVNKIEFEAGYLVITYDAGQKVRYPIADVLRDADIPALDVAKIITGTFPVARGGSGLSTIALGGMLYASALDVLSRLAPTAANQVLRSTAADALQFAVLLAADIPALDAAKITTGAFPTARIGDAAITPPKTKIKSVVALGDAAATLTAAQMIDSGIFTITPTAARALTVDTAANLVAAMPGYQVGTWFDIVIVNLAALDVTLTTNTGITLVGKMVVNNVSGTWRVRFDSATAVTIYRM